MGSTRDVCTSFNSNRVSGSKQNIRFVSMDSRDGAWCWDKTRGVLEAQVYLYESQFEEYFKDGVATWYDPADVKKRRCSGMEPTTFSQRNSSTHGEVPFKLMSLNSLVALEARNCTGQHQEAHKLENHDHHQRAALFLQTR